MNLDAITPLVLTYNEAPNIGRCLDQLTWAREVLVLDSFSDDATLEIVVGYPNTRVVQRAFDSFAGQCNYGLRECGIDTPWVLSLDADYILTPEFTAEMQAAQPAADVAAYRVPFEFRIFGSRLRGSTYGPIASLFRREDCEYENDGHAHRLRVRRGRTEPFRASIQHDDRKPFSRWIRSQATYTEQEASKLLSSDDHTLSRVDRLRKKMLFAPLVMFFYVLFVKRAILDGKAGWFYAFQRVVAEMLLSLRLLEYRLSATALESPRSSRREPGAPSATNSP